MATNASRTKSTPQAGVAPRMTYAQQLANLKAETLLVASGDRFGLLVTGPGGTSKSWTVTHTLDAQTMMPVAAPGNGHITPQGLYTFLHDHNGAVVVLDDCVSLTDKRLLGILKAATAGTTNRHGAMTRTVSWSTGVAGALALAKAGYPTSFVFTGGIIILTNSTPEISGDWQAALTRFTAIDITPTPAEVEALADAMSKRGYPLPHGTTSKRASATVCRDVREYLSMKECADLRVFVRGFAAHRALPKATDWKPLVDASVRRLPINPALAFVRELQTRPLTPHQRVQAFMEAGHGSRPTYFRYLKLVKAEKRPVTLKVAPKDIGIPDTVNNKAHHDSVLAAVRTGGML